MHHKSQATYDYIKFMSIWSVGWSV